MESNKAEREENHSYEQNVIKQLRQSLFSVDVQYRELMLFKLLLNKNLCSKFVHFFFLNNFIYKMITYTTYSINYTYIVLATNTTDTYTYTNYAYTTLRYMYYNTININLIYGWRVYKVLFN